MTPPRVAARRRYSSRPSPAAAQVAYPPRPEKYDVHLRYRIRADRDERIRQFREMEQFLKDVGFVPAPREDADLDAFDPIAERLNGTMPSANAARLFEDPRIQTAVFVPAGPPTPRRPDGSGPGAAHPGRGACGGTAEALTRAGGAAARADGLPRGRGLRHPRLSPPPRLVTGREPVRAAEGPSRPAVGVVRAGGAARVAAAADAVRAAGPTGRGATRPARRRGPAPAARRASPTAGRGTREFAEVHPGVGRVARRPRGPGPTVAGGPDPGERAARGVAGRPVPRPHRGR